jgi:hypothetical protein
MSTTRCPGKLFFLLSDDSKPGEKIDWAAWNSFWAVHWSRHIDPVPS